MCNTNALISAQWNDQSLMIIVICDLCGKQLWIFVPFYDIEHPHLLNHGHCGTKMLTMVLTPGLVGLNQLWNMSHLNLLQSLNLNVMVNYMSALFKSRTLKVTHGSTQTTICILVTVSERQFSSYSVQYFLKCVC